MYKQLPQKPMRPQVESGAGFGATLQRVGSVHEPGPVDSDDDSDFSQEYGRDLE